ncbi:hypothetical protein EGR_11219 [Echinococcus granulosus]|uniref:Uncharacterized protein n=1 Tax=Echinococcus granulosus TaxID=6210 RepID=W6UK82_ECHGR|nr:hypothetical protein EGR_11219 [Echinococcus granulosus]EUB53924.1 hypothetical protein EGR_11219 [Echinococcus granulosus]
MGFGGWPCPYQWKWAPWTGVIQGSQCGEKGAWSSWVVPQSDPAVLFTLPSSNHVVEGQGAEGGMDPMLQENAIINFPTGLIVTGSRREQRENADAFMSKWFTGMEGENAERDNASPLRIATNAPIKM